MDDIKNISDDGLLNKLHETAQDERKITARVIDLLREVDDRRLHLKKGYGSLIEFCAKELKYSESSAYRRISAMRLLNDLPEMTAKIVEGTLSLSVISQAQTFIRREEKSAGVRLDLNAKEEIIRELENKSSREAEKILIEKSPDQVRPERLRPVTATESELVLPIDRETLEMLQKIKSLISHTNPNPTYLELIKLMAKITLKKIDPESSNVAGFKSASEEPKRTATPTRLSCAQSRYVPSQVKREVWRKAQGQCCFRNGQTGKRCSSRFQLQIDHIVPISRKGKTEAGNLQLLCRQHNQMKGAENWSA